MKPSRDIGCKDCQRKSRRLEKLELLLETYRIGSDGLIEQLRWYMERNKELYQENRQLRRLCFGPELREVVGAERARPLRLVDCSGQGGGDGQG
ncbi:MAG: hypothetical protein A2284_12575 [Deltaproteobacteria bacterium RIFOXYA12_FULL_61_11]|nr:MAG: hypothetical protein A2284_12575 [Deltaproteobacteria bacterium RIFOXYA12_FULL_61_11]